MRYSKSIQKFREREWEFFDTQSFGKKSAIELHTNLCLDSQLEKSLKVVIIAKCLDPTESTKSERVQLSNYSRASLSEF